MIKGLLRIEAKILAAITWEFQDLELEGMGVQAIKKPSRSREG
jgi:hypothetical protein